VGGLSNTIELQQIYRQQNNVEKKNRIGMREQAVQDKQDIAARASIRRDWILVMQKLARTASDAEKPSTSSQRTLASSTTS
jgi:hypothetical protein